MHHCKFHSSNVKLRKFFRGDVPQDHCRPNLGISIFAKQGEKVVLNKQKLKNILRI